MPELTAEQLQLLVWMLVIVILIEGVWLAGLTYLMWRKAKEREKAKEGEKKPTEFGQEN